MPAWADYQVACTYLDETFSESSDSDLSEDSGVDLSSSNRSLRSSGQPDVAHNVFCPQRPHRLHQTEVHQHDLDRTGLDPSDLGLLSDRIRVLLDHEGLE